MANVIKLYIGIAFLGVPKGFSKAGIYGSIISLIYLLLINMFTTCLMIKARNKFKNKRIVNLSDLAFEVYGERAKWVIDFLVVITQLSFLVAYNIYFGE
jgi:amino acid permease